MKHVLMSSQMKECDRFTIDEIGIPSIVLMEKAALGIADECIAYLAARYEQKKAKENNNPGNQARGRKSRKEIR